jgi:hypothetical protein
VRGAHCSVGPTELNALPPCQQPVQCPVCLLIPCPVDNAPLVPGITALRQVSPGEGAILHVLPWANHPALLLYASQRGGVHCCDLRCARDAWHVPPAPSLGLVEQVVADPSGQHWLAQGSSRGWVCLWDVRFLLCVNSWQLPQRYAGGVQQGCAGIGWLALMWRHATTFKTCVSPHPVAAGVRYRRWPQLLLLHRALAWHKTGCRVQACRCCTSLLAGRRLACGTCLTGTAIRCGGR